MFSQPQPKLEMDDDTRRELERISRSRTESARRVERAKMMLAHALGGTVLKVSRSLSVTCPKIYRCLHRARDVGVLKVLDDRPRRGRPATISEEARAWLVALSCRKPKDLGYAEEIWTSRLLAKHARAHCRDAGHESLSKVVPGTVSKILDRQEVQPHKITYYQERRDPEFDRKRDEVIDCYRDVKRARERDDAPDEHPVAYIAYDEKPGIQATGTTSPDRPPVPGKHATIGRDHEYVRHGTVTLMAGMDLVSGHAHHTVVKQHRSREFITFLQTLDAAYSKGMILRLLLDNHSIHRSRETRAWLASMPNRFELVFTPKHASWLNIIETFFSKVARTLLRGIRVHSVDELTTRIKRYFEQINAEPVVFSSGLTALTMRSECEITNVILETKY